MNLSLRIVSLNAVINLVGIENQELVKWERIAFAFNQRKVQFVKLNLWILVAVPFVLNRRYWWSGVLPLSLFSCLVVTRDYSLPLGKGCRLALLSSDANSRAFELDSTGLQLSIISLWIYESVTLGDTFKHKMLVLFFGQIAKFINRKLG